MEQVGKCRHAAVKPQLASGTVPLSSGLFHSESAFGGGVRFKRGGGSHERLGRVIGPQMQRDDQRSCEQRNGQVADDFHDIGIARKGAD